MTDCASIWQLESALVEPPRVTKGLAFVTQDIDAAAAALGDGLGRVKDAVQPGRRIGTVRTKDLDISVALALMTPHVKKQ